MWIWLEKQLFDNQFHIVDELKKNPDFLDLMGEIKGEHFTPLS